MAEQVEIHGLKEVLDRIKSLPDELRKGPVRKATFAMARAMREAVKKNTPEASDEEARRSGAVKGLLKQSISVFFIRQTDPDTIRYSVGERRIKRQYANTRRNRRMRRVGKKYTVAGAGFYAKFVEHGTQGGQRNGKGITPPRKFITKTFEAEKATMPGIFAAALAKDFDRIVKKLAKQ